MKVLERLLNTTAGKLRYPWLVLLTATLFIADLLIPDAIPLIDEILLGLATLLLTRKRQKKTENPQEQEKNNKKNSTSEK